MVSADMVQLYQLVQQGLVAPGTLVRVKFLITEKASNSSGRQKELKQAVADRGVQHVWTDTRGTGWIANIPAAHLNLLADLPHVLAVGLHEDTPLSVYYNPSSQTGSSGGSTSPAPIVTPGSTTGGSTTGGSTTGGSTTGGSTTGWPGEPWIYGQGVPGAGGTMSMPGSMAQAGAGGGMLLVAGLAVLGVGAWWLANR